MCENKMNADDAGNHWWKGAKVGLLVGIPGAVLSFALLCFIASEPAPTLVSLSLAFRPWWSNWWPALIVGLVLFVVFGVAGAIRARREPPAHEHKKGST